MNYSSRRLAVFARVLLAVSVSLPMTLSVAGGVDPDQTGWPAAGKYTKRLIVKMQAPAKGVLMSASEGTQIASAMSVVAGRTLSFSHETGVGAAILTTDTRMTLAEASRSVCSRKPTFNSRSRTYACFARWFQTTGSTPINGP